MPIFGNSNSDNNLNGDVQEAFRSITPEQYQQIRELMEDVLFRVDNIAARLHATGKARERNEAHQTDSLRRSEDPMFLDSCSQVALDAARELRVFHGVILHAMSEIFPHQELNLVLTRLPRAFTDSGWEDRLVYRNGERKRR